MNLPQALPIVIPCLGSAQVGIFHGALGDNHKTAILMVVAGGPQYRVGRARQLITWARYLANAGYPVLRFDYRGLGDSAGPFLGFEHIDDDIKAAIDDLVARVPGVENIVMWGECNSTSAIMMVAWRDSRVTGMIIRDPWVRDETTEAKTYIKHYYWQRLRDKSFWLKLLKGQFNPLKSVSSLFSLWQRSKQAQPGMSAQVADNFDSLPTYQQKMLEGYSRFLGKTLLLMNGGSLTGKEFEVLVASSSRWQETMANQNITRLDDQVSEADNFSLLGYSRRIGQDALQWLRNSGF